MKTKFVKIEMIRFSKGNEVEEIHENHSHLIAVNDLIQESDHKQKS